MLDEILNSKCQEGKSVKSIQLGTEDISLKPHQCTKYENDVEVINVYHPNQDITSREDLTLHLRFCNINLNTRVDFIYRTNV